VTALDDAQGPLTLHQTPTGGFDAGLDGSVLLGAAPAAAEGGAALVEAQGSAAAGGAAEGNAEAAPAAVLGGEGTGAAAASRPTATTEAAQGAAQEAPSAASSLDGTLPSAATQVTVASASAAPAGQAAEAGRSRTAAASAAAPALVFQFGNGAFINTAAPLNSPQQQVADRVFRALGLERADASTPVLVVGPLADTVASRFVAELTPAGRPQDVLDSLFGEGSAAELDWLSGVDALATEGAGGRDTAGPALVPGATAWQEHVDRDSVDDCFAGSADNVDEATDAPAGD
jgi:hypothetical protein